jgi:DNA mismatch repair ATPase MutS
MENPAEARKRGSKAIVHRDVVRIVTPGTLTEDGLLDARGANRLAAIALRGGQAAVASVELSTGEVESLLIAPSGLSAALAALQPSEILVPDRLFADETVNLALKSGKKESLLYAVYAYVLMEMSERDKAIEVLNKGLEICKGDERLITNRNLLQNGKALKMKVYGEQWYQFLLERPMIRQEAPSFARVSRRALRG